MALANLMRLSLLKAAQAVLSGNALEIGSPILFNPCTRNPANLDWIRKKASAILERVLRVGPETLGSGEAL